MRLKETTKEKAHSLQLGYPPMNIMDCIDVEIVTKRPYNYLKHPISCANIEDLYNGPLCNKLINEFSPRENVVGVQFLMVRSSNLHCEI